jgi:hypothetical protein
MHLGYRPDAHLYAEIIVQPDGKPVVHTAEVRIPGKQARNDLIGTAEASTMAEMRIFGDYAFSPTMLGGRAGDDRNAERAGLDMKSPVDQQVLKNAMKILETHQPGLDRVSHYMSAHWGKAISHDELTKVYEGK